MPTNDRKINIYHSRLLDRTGIKTRLLDFLSSRVSEVAAAIFQGTSGVLDSDEIELNNDHGGSTFDLDLTNAHNVIVGTGQIINLSLLTGAGITHTIPFQNSAGIAYYIGIKYQEVEDGIELNPRRGTPEYPALKQTFGEKNAPTSVTDHATYIRLVVDSITENGVTHAGRVCKIWLVVPKSGVESIAYYSGVVAYDAGTGNNYVDIPYTAPDGPLGQDVSAGPPSTTASDYVVFIEGATWKRNTDLRLDSSYAFIGIATGGAPPAFSVSDQIPIFINTLDRAYDGATGHGSGRLVQLDHGAIEAISSGAITDEHQAQLRLNRYGNTEYFQLSLECLTGNKSSVPLAILCPISSGANLHANESADIAGANTINFTRVGVNLNAAGVRINRHMHVVWVDNSPANDGLWLIESSGAASLTVFDPKTGAAPAVWTAAAGVNVRILTPRLILGNSEVVPPAAGISADYWNGILMTLTDGNERAISPLRIMADGAGASDAVMFYDSNIPAVKRLNVTGEGVISQDSLLLTPKPLTSVNYSLTISPETMAVGDHRLPCHQQALINAANGSDIKRLEAWGNWASVHHFVDFFNYRSNPAHVWAESFPAGVGSFKYCDASSYSGGGNVLAETAGTGASDTNMLHGPPLILVKNTLGDHQVFFKARVRIISSLINVAHTVGLVNFVADPMHPIGIYFRYENGAGPGAANWKLICKNSVDADQEASMTLGTLGGLVLDDEWVDVYFHVDAAADKIYGWMTGQAEMQEINLLNGFLNIRLNPYYFVGQVGSATVKRGEICYIETWDNHMMSGPAY